MTIRTRGRRVSPVSSPRRDHPPQSGSTGIQRRQALPRLRRLLHRLRGGGLRPYLGRHRQPSGRPRCRAGGGRLNPALAQVRTQTKRLVTLNSLIFR